MSFSNIDVLRLGTITQIVFSKGVLYQASEDTREWEQVQSLKVSDQAARELRFMLQKSLGPAASQYRNPGTSNRTFPQASQAIVQEFIAKFKEMNTTLKLEYQLWERALMAKSAKYMEPLALEVQSKATAQKRVLCADFYGDGTGVRGTASSIDEGSIAAGTVVVTLQDTDTARGNVGAFELYDILVLYQNGGSARTASLSGGSQPYGWQVTDRDFSTNKITFTLIDSSENAVTNVTATNLASGDVFYRVGQPTIPNLGGISDYGTATEALVGLDSLAATDGRTVWGITMSGAYKSSMYDASGDTMDVLLFDKALSSGKRRVGQGRYKYKKAAMADEVHTQLIDSREADRRFMSVTDNKRGTTFFGYQHRNDLIECYTSEFISKHRVWFLPEGGTDGKKVLEFHGSDWKAVKTPGGEEFHLNAASGGGYTNDIVSYMRGIGVLICRHPAAMIGIRNFALST